MRRGRIVPASRYLSLTGSTFGVPHVGTLDENESFRSRSRSPFEWWRNMAMERSPSRQDDMSQVETGSITRVESRSSAPGIYGRKDFSVSTHSLLLEKDTEQSQTMQPEVEDAHQGPSPVVREPSSLLAPPPSHLVNFSRTLVPRTSSSPLAHRHNVLSRIEESSPRHSIISMTSALRHSSLRSSAYGKDHGADPPVEASKNIDAPSLPSPGSCATTSSTSSERSSSLQQPPEVAKPEAYRRSRSSPEEAEQLGTRLSCRSSPDSRRESVRDRTGPSRRTSKITMTGSPSPPADYWATRADLRPISRQMSKKGNVLRKKSLRRSEVVSVVDA